MSSEGSVSSNGSRIRQFGLYRSIDARTEEFLRLSRRRQIRQGCACAAVSTAITVAVVIVVIFVYEFSLNSEVNEETSLRTKWFSLINDTTENGFKTKFTESGIDKSTLTLLPILLKALKKNDFLEKFLEAQSSPSPAYEEKSTTEYNFEKNVFTRNWLSIPPSKVYAIAYKTSPLAFYKSSSKNIEYFTKIRKIRDYQRMMNYMEKMINEKVYIGSTKPMVTNTEGPITARVLKFDKAPDIKPDYQSKPVPTRTKADVDGKNHEKNYKRGNCMCPMKLNQLLNKILLGIEKLLSINTHGETVTMADCHPEKTSKLNRFEEKSSIPGIIENETTRIETINTTRKEDNDKNIQTKALDQRQNSTETIEKASQINNQYNNDVKNFEISTPLLNDYLDATDDILKFVTKPMISVNKYKSTMMDQYKNNISSIADDQRRDYFTAKDVTEFVNKRTTQTEKLRQDTFDNRKIQVFKPPSYKKPQFVYSSNLTKNNWLKNLNKAIYQTFERDENIKMKPMPTETTTKLFNIKLTTKPVHLTDLNKKLMKPEKVENKKTKNILTRTVDKETQNENSLETQESMLNPNENSKDSSSETNVSVAEVLWEELKNEDNIPAWKSMLPNHRPIYLEIQQRNDWKHEEQDYDFNLLNTYDNIPDQVL